jgi:hypothetical protein
MRGKWNRVAGFIYLHFKQLELREFLEFYNVEEELHLEMISEQDLVVSPGSLQCI